MAILVTGGAGYIGSHTLIKLLESGNDVVVVDNLCNSNIESIRRVKQITGEDFPFYCDDVRDEPALRNIFTREEIDGVIHFAGLKAVGESVEIPLEYYDNNIGATLNLLKVMKAFGVKRLVFSSSATVYGDPKTVPISENFPLFATNPYGATKLMIEGILKDLYSADPNWEISILRYFNPVGAHESGRIGEDPNGIPNNLVPYITKVAIGNLDRLKVFGNDYDTIDGTGVRDYIHVMDLANGHLLALKKLEKDGGLDIYNLGTGMGYSVLEMVRAFEKAAGKEIPYEIVSRRAGDIGSCFADTRKAFDEINFKTEKGLEEMCTDSWRWQSNNPNGYK